MCWAGCCAKKYFIMIFGILNTGMLGTYFFALLVDCGSDCGYSNDTEKLITSIIAPATLFLLCYILCFIGVQRSRNNIDGCHNAVVGIYILFLFVCAVGTCWNAYNMFHDELGGQLYFDLSFGTAIYNIAAMLVTCNFLMRSDDDIKKRSNHANYQSTLDDQTLDYTHQNDIHQL